MSAEEWPQDGGSPFFATPLVLFAVPARAWLLARIAVRPPLTRSKHERRRQYLHVQVLFDRPRRHLETRQKIPLLLQQLRLCALLIAPLPFSLYLPGWAEPACPYGFT